MMFFAYIHKRGTLHTSPFKDERTYEGAKASPHMNHVTEPFEASGHVEARQIAERQIGKFARPLTNDDLFN